VVQEVMDKQEKLVPSELQELFRLMVDLVLVIMVDLVVLVDMGIIHLMLEEMVGLVVVD
jgi:hypothetical protein